MTWCDLELFGVGVWLVSGCGVWIQLWCCFGAALVLLGAYMNNSALAIQQRKTYKVIFVGDNDKQYDDGLPSVVEKHRHRLTVVDTSD